MDIVLKALLVVLLVVLVRFMVERIKGKAFEEGKKAARIEARQPEIDALEEPRSIAGNKFAGLHRWLSVLLDYPPFAVDETGSNNFFGRQQTQLGERFNEELIQAEQWDSNLSVEEEIQFLNHCFDALMSKYSKEIAEAEKNRDLRPLYPAHRGFSKEFDKQFND